MKNLLHPVLLLMGCITTTLVFAQHDSANGSSSLRKVGTLQDISTGSGEKKISGQTETIAKKEAVKEKSLYQKKVLAIAKLQAEANLQSDIKEIKKDTVKKEAAIPPVKAQRKIHYIPPGPVKKQNFSKKEVPAAKPLAVKKEKAITPLHSKPKPKVIGRSAKTGVAKPDKSMHKVTPAKTKAPKKPKQAKKNSPQKTKVKAKKKSPVHKVKKS